MLLITAPQIVQLFAVGRFSRTVRVGSGEPSYVIGVPRFVQSPIRAGRRFVWTVCVMVLAAPPSMAQVQATRFSQRLLALQQQNVLQQQQSAVQKAVQQTAILVQAAPQKNGMTLQSINFQQQQVALRVAIQQTLALLQTGQGNAALSRTALGQLNTLQLVLQQSIILQNASQMQSNPLTPEQLLVLSQEQRTLSSLVTTQPIPLPNKTPGGRTH
jgi:hypothetical protein